MTRGRTSRNFCAVFVHLFETDGAPGELRAVAVKAVTPPVTYIRKVVTAAPVRSSARLRTAGSGRPILRPEEVAGGEKGLRQASGSVPEREKFEAVVDELLRPGAWGFRDGCETLTAGQYVGRSVLGVGRQLTTACTRPTTRRPSCKSNAWGGRVWPGVRRRRSLRCPIRI